MTSISIYTYTYYSTHSYILHREYGKKRDSSPYQMNVTENCTKLVAFSYSFTGCDTVSAFHNKGKKFSRSKRQQVEIFYNNITGLKKILEAGRYCAILLYESAKDIQLNELKNIENLEK